MRAAHGEKLRARAAPTERRAWSPAHVVGIVVLGAWAGTFWWLLATERTSLYLSSRTAWVVPLGAVLLTIAVAGRVAFARTKSPEPIDPRSALGAALLVLPSVMVLTLPPAALGTYAAGRRSSLAGAAAFGSSSDEIASGAVTLSDVAGALRSREGMKALVARAGEEVTFVGFVDRSSDMPADEFMLTRFLVSCCAADALSLQVRIVGAAVPDISADDWVRVTGKLYPLGHEVLVEAVDVTKVARPKHPYLNG
jgi:uncharacterized repeat protein (TIGR03943 family)